MNYVTFLSLIESLCSDKGLGELNERIHEPFVKYMIVTDELNWVKEISEIGFCYRWTGTWCNYISVGEPLSGNV